VGASIPWRRPQGSEWRHAAKTVYHAGELGGCSYSIYAAYHPLVCLRFLFLHRHVSFVFFLYAVVQASAPGVSHVPGPVVVPPQATCCFSAFTGSVLAFSLKLAIVAGDTSLFLASSPVREFSHIVAAKIDRHSNTEARYHI
jgi:hypothetical protein